MRTILYIVAFSFLTAEARAALPTGFLDRADREVITGWAKDQDHSGSLRVHIYVDGVFVASLLANVNRTDVGGKYGFHWSHNRNFGPGVHEIRAYAIGVDATGAPDGQNKELHHSPRSLDEPRFYTLVSEDGDIEVDVDARFGGAIGRLEDFVYFPGVSLVHGNHGGAALQSAFWYPRAELPPGCPDEPGMDAVNPTQGGFYADVVSGIHAGNPIGIHGTEKTRFDPNEFIRFEDDGRTVHLRSKMIRHDYCVSPHATESLRQLWDTDWYIEQWVSFDSRFARTVQLHSQLQFVGTSPVVMDSRQLPIIFANHLPRVAYWKNGEKVLTAAQTLTQVTPDTPWAAIVGAKIEAGLGMVYHPNADFLRFNSASGLFAFDIVEGVSRLYASGEGHIKLETIGELNGGTSNSNGYLYEFQPGATFDWDAYFPIGSLTLIRQQAMAVHREAFFDGNRPPTVDAGPDQTVVFPYAASLSGSVDDDGLPNGQLTLTWSKVSGPGTATFSSRTVANPTVRFSWIGDYILRLHASDGELSSFDELTVFVRDESSYTPSYASAPNYVPPGYTQSSAIRRTTLANGIRLSVDGTPQSPVAIQQGTTRGHAFAAPSGKRIQRIAFDVAANYDLNLLRAGVDIPGGSFYWQVDQRGSRSVVLDLPFVPWVGFHFAVTRGHPGIPFQWIFQVTNVRLTLVEDPTQVTTPSYGSAPNYVPGGWTQSTTLRRTNLSNGIRLSIDGASQNPVGIQQGTTRGFSFSAPPGRLLTRIEFDVVANYDMNLLRAGFDVPGVSVYWSLDRLGSRSVTIDLPRVPWVGFHFAVLKGHPGIPFQWIFQLANVRLSHVPKS